MTRYFAPAKINLFLHIVGRRPDGYHLLQSVFRLLDVGDTLDIMSTLDGDIIHENPLAGVPAETDLTIRAARLLQQESGCGLGCRIHIDKRLPMGGGLGGGSSDAATVLMALNQQWGLNWSRERLMQLGLRLGADVPIFIFGQDAFAEGIGEKLTAIRLPEMAYVVLIPPVHVSTQEIFSDENLTRDSEPIIMAAFPDLPTRNDMQAVAVRKYPVIGEYLNWLSQFSHAMMTGSGACVFAAFDTLAEAEEVISRLPETMRGFVAQNLKQHAKPDLPD